VAADPMALEVCVMCISFIAEIASIWTNSCVDSRVDLWRWIV
jgi:hypothetical protein